LYEKKAYKAMRKELVERIRAERRATGRPLVVETLLPRGALV
jgi:hypothetical protein